MPSPADIPTLVASLSLIATEAERGLARLAAEDAKLQAALARPVAPGATGAEHVEAAFAAFDAEARARAAVRERFGKIVDAATASRPMGSRPS